MAIRVLLLSVALSLVGSANAAAPGATATPAPVAKAPSIDAERARVLAWTRELEAAPLAEDAADKRAWLMEWLRNVRGLKVHVCDVFGAREQQNKKVSGLLVQQYMFGSASYLIEHPSVDGRKFVVQEAGVASAINAYSVLREADPLQRVGHFDYLLDLQAKGELSEYVSSEVFSKCGLR